ncbi:MAG: flavoprotein [Desulfosporosinus sp.]|nr:flavoprotein [Desulfosporosinus sp.]
MAERGKKIQSRIAWGITGAGHFLSSSIENLLALNEVDVFLSQAAKEILPSYGLWETLKGSSHRIFLDESASSRSITKLYSGEYKLVVIAPVTSNSIAKMICGIADNLITNLFAHAGKCQIPVVLLPCDSQPEINSLTPQGVQVLVHAREVDLENLSRLANWPGVSVVDDIDGLKSYLDTFLAEQP